MNLLQIVLIMTISTLVSILEKLLSSIVLETIDIVTRDPTAILVYENAKDAVLGEMLKKFSDSCRKIQKNGDNTWNYVSTIVNYVAYKLNRLIVLNNPVDYENYTKEQTMEDNAIMLTFIKMHVGNISTFVNNFQPITSSGLAKIRDTNTKNAKIFEDYKRKIVQRMSELGHIEEIKRIDKFVEEDMPNKEEYRDIHKIFIDFQHVHVIYEGVYVYVDNTIEDGIKALMAFATSDDAFFKGLDSYILACNYSMIVLHSKTSSMNGLYYY